MNAATMKGVDTTKPPVVREYDIRGTKYIVYATEKAGADEDAVTKVRRLILNDISGNYSDKGNNQNNILADKRRYM